MGEYVMVPREWVESTVKAGAGEVIVLSDIATLAECLNKMNPGEPVATVRGVTNRKSSVFDIVIHYNQALHPGTKLFLHADPGEVERLRIALGNTQALLDQANYHKAQRGETIDALRAQLAELRQCLAGLAYLGTGAAYERAIAALSASAEPSAPVEIDERTSFEANVPLPAYVYWDEKQSRYLTNCNHSACAVYQGSFEGWLARAALERKP